MKKAELRKEYLSKQKAISRKERSVASERIAQQFFSNFDLTSIRYIHCFIPIEKFNEVDTRLILDVLWRDHSQIETVVPRVDFEMNEITNVKFTHDTHLVKNVWDIDEPSHDEFVETEKIDMVLVPGLCFDRDGHRIGYGKGFYDRFLMRCRPDCLRVGLSYFELVQRIDDAYEGDVALDWIVTPRGVQKTVPRV